MKKVEIQTGTFQFALQKLGLNQKESEVYIALLSIGAGLVSDISKKSHIHRTTVYDILNSLISKGLVSISGKEPKQEFRCEDPEKILKFLKRDIDKKEENYRYAELLVPELKSIHKLSGRPQIKFYEGKEGLEEVYEDTLTAKETILAYANVDNMHAALPNYFPKYYKRRAGKNISIKAIIPKTKMKAVENKECTI